MVHGLNEFLRFVNNKVICVKNCNDRRYIRYLQYKTDNYVINFEITIHWIQDNTIREDCRFNVFKNKTNKYSFHTTDSVRLRTIKYAF